MGLARVARAVSRSTVCRNARVPKKTLASGYVLSVLAMADGRAARAGATARARQRTVHRPLSRSGARHGPMRLRSLGASRVLCFGLPRGLSAGRFFTQGPGLGVPATQLGTSLGIRLRTVHRI